MGHDFFFKLSQTPTSSVHPPIVKSWFAVVSFALLCNRNHRFLSGASSCDLLSGWLRDEPIPFVVNPSSATTALLTSCLNSRHQVKHVPESRQSNKRTVWFALAVVRPLLQHALQISPQPMVPGSSGLVDLARAKIPPSHAPDHFLS